MMMVFFILKIISLSLSHCYYHTVSVCLSLCLSISNSLPHFLTFSLYFTHIDALSLSTSQPLSHSLVLSKPISLNFIFYLLTSIQARLQTHPVHQVGESSINTRTFSDVLSADDNKSWKGYKKIGNGREIRKLAMEEKYKGY